MAEAIRALGFLSPTPRTPWRLGVLFPIITVLIFFGPIIAGLAGTLLPAFGYQPTLGGNSFSLFPWHALLAEPGLSKALAISLSVGFGATFIALIMAVAIVLALYDRPFFTAIRRGLAPMLAIPHSGFAIGWAFLLAPSGWLFRMVSPDISGWQRPPDLLILQDPGGFSLMFVLAFKEVFFLLLMILAALPQVNASNRLRVARLMGYTPIMAWLKVVLPALYPQIRLPVYAVLVTGLSTVDMALIMGPTAPPPLSVLLWQWFQDFDLQYQFTAAAGAVLQLLLVLVSILVWCCGEKVIASCSQSWLVSGRRDSRWITPIVRGLGVGSVVIVYLSTVLSLIAMLLWALAKVWRWPNAWPSGLSLDTFVSALPLIGQPLVDTLLIGLSVAVVALVLVIGCLEYETQQGRSLGKKGFWLLYLPLLLPQIGFLFGVQTLWVSFDIDGSRLAVAWSHLLFVLPFCYLSLADPYRSLDPRIARTARSLGASALRLLLLIKLPLLLRPLMVSLAIGFSVSVAQYLPTLFAGSGRVVTLTTEAVGLASGADRRLLGVLVFVQALLPLAVFVIAIALPSWVARRRRGLSL